MSTRVMKEHRPVIKELKELRNELDLGLGIVTRIWGYKAKDWVTSVCVADIDNDGDAEVIACSRDGRVHALSSSGDFIWERVVGKKGWIGTVVVCRILKEGEDPEVRIFIGTREGKVYVLNQNGGTISKDGKVYDIDDNGEVAHPEEEIEAYWYNTSFVIRQIYVDPAHPDTIIFGSEDRCVYALDYKTGDLLWKYQTNGWVRAVFSCDIDGDGKAEILAGSVDKSVYVIDQQGKLLAQYRMKYPVHTLFCAQIEKDGPVEILVGTDGKDLTALLYHKEGLPSGKHFQRKWYKRFPNRLLSLYVTDIDNDGHGEIFASSEDKHIYIIDGRGNIIWQHNHKFLIFSLYAYDIDNDGVPELLMGSDHERVSTRRIRLRKGLGKKIGRYYQKLIDSENASLSGLTTDQRDLLADLFAENVQEHINLALARKLLDEEQHSQALRTLLQLQQNKVERLLQDTTVGFVRTVCLRHVSGKVDSREIILVNTEGHVQAFNTKGELLWQAYLDDHIVDVQTGFLDHDPDEEVVACSSDHRVYILHGASKGKPRAIHIDAWTSSVCVTTPALENQAEIIIGSEDKKLLIYGSNLGTPIRTINTPDGIRVVRARRSNSDDDPGIIAASLGHVVYAYSHNGKEAWRYETRGRIRAISVKDIDEDGVTEILIGSDDRNVHVLDSKGHLLWRFFLPHSALSIDAADIDGDGKMEVFVGCADGYLHVLNHQGDLLWKYHTGDRIHAVCAEDIDGDGNVEIALGSEDKLELLRVVNQKQVEKMIEECWTKVRSQHHTRPAINERLEDPDPLQRAFALSKLAEQEQPLTPRDFDSFERYIKEGAVEIRKALIRVLMTHYPDNSIKARQLLLQLSMDIHIDVKDTFVDHILLLMKHDWELGFYYLKRFLDHPDRCVRRMVIRKLYQLIDTPVIGEPDRHREIFEMLLIAAQDKESEWIRQEAARSLAHYFNKYHGGLIIYVHRLVVEGIDRSILERIAYATTVPVVKQYINVVAHMLSDSDLNEENALKKTLDLVHALKGASSHIYGKDTYLLYKELYQLLTLDSIEDIAHYQCSLNINQFLPHNTFAKVMLRLFEKLDSISRELLIYLKRNSVHDRLSILLEVMAAIEQMKTFTAQQYSTYILGDISKLPDHTLFTLLLKKWQDLVMEQLNRLRGKAEVKAELQTKYTRFEDQVVVWFTVSNTGRSSANNLKTTLLYNENFDVIGQNSSEAEVLLPQDELTREFIIKPHTPILDLQLEVVYNDVEGPPRVEAFGDRLELSSTRRKFHLIPNPYSTGLPTHDIHMFYGREADMVFLKDNLGRDAKTVIVLYGQRRSGKTTLLFQLIKAFAQHEPIPVLIDMQGITYDITISSFLYNVALTIAQAMQKKEIPVCQPQVADFDAQPIVAFNAFLDSIEADIVRQKLILMVDEFEILEEQVVNKTLKPAIFDYLRDILQHRRNINFLFSGTHKITEHTRWYRSVFFNIARHYRLSRLSQQGAEDLIQKPVEGFLEYEPHTVKRIRQLTADQPYLIHLMCRAIVDYCNDRRKTYVTINDIRSVLYDVMQTGEFHFDWLWDQISPRDRVVLSAIAADEREDGHWLSLAGLEEICRRNAIQLTREHLRASLKALLEADLVEKEPGDSRDGTYENSRYRILVGLTRTWLRQEKPLETVRKELSN